MIAETKQLTKIFHGRKALDSVSITLKQGGIYGLIGQNGAGKTTLMRLLCGLTEADSGSLSLFGHEKKKELVKERKRIGCLIESPACYPAMTAADNMELYRIMKGLPESGEEAELLKLVGIGDTGKKKVKDFSLGMRQRLGIAMSLLGNPELLILDEPMNGLDPAGIAQIRGILTDISKNRRITVLLSSHILSELYQVATDYIIIHQGRVIRKMTLKELNEQCRRHILLKTDNADRAAAVLMGGLSVKDFLVMPDGSIKLFEFLDETETIYRVLSKGGVSVKEISVEGDSLEGYYLSLIGGQNHVEHVSM